jgi:hypothetical protein
VMLCDKLIEEQSIECVDPNAGFVWVEGKALREVLPSNSGASAH